MGRLTLRRHLTHGSYYAESAPRPRCLTTLTAARTVSASRA
jgi:hypothetical protein